MARYKVIAPLVNVKTMTDEGLQWRYVYAGGIVPADAGEQWIANHLRDRMIEEIPEPQQAAPPAPEPPAAPQPAAKIPAARTRSPKEE